MNRMIGKRVKVIKGMGEDEYAGFMLWIAGKVPVGSIGTLQKTRLSSHGQFHIEWDGITAKDGYLFGVEPHNFEEYFEFIDQEVEQ